ncbi:MAG: hypothetical protein HN816_09165 [Gammaproteobacteria bacterium]|nr:hypothetical protein [Gammaproteobacteria bacterium]
MTSANSGIWLSTILLMLLSACGAGGGDSAENTVINPPEPRQDGITGKAASRISGASLAVHDANGEEIVLASGRTTNQNGAYHLIFSEFAIQDGITPPLVVTLDGRGATAICDYDREGDNDCIAADGSFVSFGTTYTLPDGFELRGLAPTFPDFVEGGSDRTINVNLSAASDLATRYALDAAVGTLTAAAVDLANNQALGVVEFLTGLSSRGQNINDIAIADLTAAQIPTTDRLGLALFGASLHGQINTDEPSVSKYHLVLNRMENRIRPAPSGLYLSATGTFLAESVASYIVTATAFQNSLTSPSAVLAGSIAAGTTSQPLLVQVGGNPVNIAIPADPSSTDPLDRTKVFISSFSEVIGSTLLISQTAAFGGTAAGAALVYNEQLSLLGTLVSEEMRNTLIQLDQAISTALENGETELTGTNVSGVLEQNADTVTLTVATSTSSNIQTGISVNITIPTGTRFNPGGNGSISASDITIAVSQTQTDLTTQELFEGSFSVELSGAGQVIDTTSVTFSGDLRSTGARNFTGNIAVTGLAPISSELEEGNYDASFTFDDGGTLSMSGQLQTQISNTTLSVGASTIMVDLETNRITDMNTDLNLSVDQSSFVTGGSLVSGGVDTGTMDASGIVFFSDDTAVALPAPVI